VSKVSASSRRHCHRIISMEGDRLVIGTLAREAANERFDNLPDSLVSVLFFIGCSSRIVVSPIIASMLGSVVASFWILSWSMDHCM